MMYNNKLVVSLKANGRILRENKDTILIPFGSEYSFLLKNLHTQRAVVNIFIDGDNIVEGGLVINAGQEVNLERYIKNGNLTEGNRFKFIERTAAIEDGPRGIKLEDGLVRIEFQYEKPPMRVNELPRSIFNHIDFGNISGNMGSSEYPGVTDKYSKSINNSWIQASGTSYSTNVNGAMRGVDWSQNGAAMQASASAAIDKAVPMRRHCVGGRRNPCQSNLYLPNRTPPRFPTRSKETGHRRVESSTTARTADHAGVFEH
jgi:hypothetical protein